MLTTCSTASWRKISNVFASKRLFRGLRTCESRTTLHETNLTLFEARVTYSRRLAYVSLANCDTPELYDVTLYSIVQFGLQVLPSIRRYCHRHSLHSLPNALFYPPPTHPPPAPIIIISPRYERYETIPEAHPDDIKVVRKLVRRAIRNLVGW